MELHSISLTVNGQPYGGEVEPRLLLSDYLRHELEADRHACGLRLRARGMWGLHGAPGWSAGAVLLDACGPGRGVMRWRPWKVLRAALKTCIQIQEAFLGSSRIAMRLLHTRFPHDVGAIPGGKPGSNRNRDPGSDIRKLVPLHRLSKHCGSGSPCG